MIIYANYKKKYKKVRVKQNYNVIDKNKTLMINSRIENIIVKFLNNQASNVELDELETWISDSKNELLFKAYIKTNYAIDYNLKKFNADKVKKRTENYNS